MDSRRRNFLRGLMAVGGAAVARPAAAQHVHRPAPAPRDAGPRLPLTSPVFAPGIPAVDAPDLPKMPWRMEDGVKVFNIRTEAVRTEFVPGRIVDAWGFNGSVPGPTIEVMEGDRLRLIVENGLPEPFTMHWHGLEVPMHMDGGPGLSQDPILPGGRFTYEFRVRQNGTFFYHSHGAMQEMMGMIGLFIIHPRKAYTPTVHRDFGLVFQEWAILPNNTIPNTLAMEFNWLTINGKAGPATTPMLVKAGERVRIRMVNLGMDHHPIHLHGNTFYITGTEGGRIHTTAMEPGNTVLLGVAQSRDLEFEANNVGDWMLHCHLPHHMMNQMTSMVGPMTEASTGLKPGGMSPGMGIVGGAALSAQSGPAFGRTLAIGAEPERAAPNTMATSQPPAFLQPGRADTRTRYPGYPQDMFMAMDDLFKDKPETYGLRPGWTMAMMGMMTLVRVLEPELFDRIHELKAQQAQAAGRAL